jgi:signal transduction histidine kinase/CheY-like chemotaxis protein
VSAATICGIIALERIASLTPEPLRGADGMSAASALCAALLALSLVVRSLSLKRAPVVIETIGLVVASVPLIGYVFGAEALFSNPLYTQMALHTALGHVCLFIALLLVQPQQGWVEVLLAEDAGSRMARRVLPVTVVAPLIFALLVAEAVELNLMTVEFRLAVLTATIIFATVTAVIFFAYLTNLAERRSAEAEEAYLRSEMLRQQMELSAVRAEKLAALGKLVGGVAHDFNNMLNVILGNLELLAEDPHGADHDEYVSEAIDASNRAAALTAQLLAYGRKSNLKPANVPLEDEIDGALRMFSRVCPANISMIRKFHGQGMAVRLDPEALRQSVLNVLINARDAMPGGGEIRIVTERTTLDGAALARFHEAETLPSGPYAVLRIEDTGTGMKPEDAARASEPFFTTKGVGEGTGLGLSTVAGFCRQSGGALGIASVPGVGTSITMAFPASTIGPAPAPTVTGPAEKETRKPGGILIVDDDAALARIMATQLARVGHSVRTAHDARQALSALQDGPLPEVVLTDMAMPGEMQGQQLAAIIRERYPNVEIILMSGYASQSQQEQIATDIDMPFLQKPIDVRTLRTIVARVTAGAGPVPSDGSDT